jgi:hypothetical protein
MSVFLHVVSLASTTGLPRDVIQNTYVVREDGVALTPSPVAAVGSRIAEMYSTSVPGDPTGLTTVANFESYLSFSLSAEVDAHSVKSYFLTNDPLGVVPKVNGKVDLGSPVATFTFTTNALGGATALPQEVACAVSFHGEVNGLEVQQGATRPASRHRGRIFIGPLAANCVTANAAGQQAGRVSPIFVGALHDTFESFLNDQPGWSVWSRVNSTVYPVIGGYIDDRFDSQRRRQEAATSRTTFVQDAPAPG